LGLDDWPVQLHARGHGEAIASLLVGTGNPVCPGVRTPNGDLPGTALPQSGEFAVHELSKVAGGSYSAGCRRGPRRVGQGDDNYTAFLRGDKDVSITESVQDDALE
jgi:hypothetical protein